MCNQIKTFTFEVPEDILTYFRVFCDGFKVNAEKRKATLTIILQCSMRRGQGFKIIQMVDELNVGSLVQIEFTKAIFREQEFTERD